ncbi:phosphatase [Klebsiella michiganensis]|uniref:Phosphatase n=1 Tax=Klebsiella michiganensis TaxID=1134687 RepID=A0A7H4N3L0_9ENTR|nr:phosphatase [Klebsiella michiganensis]
MTSRVIALDLDGTLLTGKKTILPASLDALARAKDAGISDHHRRHRPTSRRYPSFLSGAGAGYTCNLLQWHLFV